MHNIEHNRTTVPAVQLFYWLFYFAELTKNLYLLASTVATVTFTFACCCSNCYHRQWKLLCKLHFLQTKVVNIKKYKRKQWLTKKNHRWKGKVAKKSKLERGSLVPESKKVRSKMVNRKRHTAFSFFVALKRSKARVCFVDWSKQAKDDYSTTITTITTYYSNLRGRFSRRLFHQKPQSALLHKASRKFLLKPP